MNRTAKLLMILALLACLVGALAAVGCGSSAATTTTQATSAPTTGGASPSTSAATPTSATPTTATQTTGGAATGTPYKVGLVTSISGPLGFLGVQIRDAAQLAVDKANAAGGINGHPVQLVIEDDAGDPGQAVTKITKVVSDDKVLAVTGMFLVALESTLRPLAERLQVPYMSQIQTVPQYRTMVGKYWFDDAPSEFVVVPAWIKVLKEKGFTNIVANGTNDTLTDPTLNELKKEGEAAGITVNILPDKIGTDAVDATPQIIALKKLIDQTKAQALVTMVWPNNMQAMLTAMGNQGVKIPIFMPPWGADESILQMVPGGELNGITIVGLKTLAGDSLPDTDPQKAIIQDFAKSYQDKTKAIAGEKAAYSYTSVQLILDAIKRAGDNPTPQSVRDAMEATQNLVTVVGTFNYSPTDHEGLQANNCLCVYEIQNNKHVYKESIQ
jgi:branched-chain amino acid transport system substrate-binding protein